MKKKKTFFNDTLLKRFFKKVKVILYLDIILKKSFLYLDNCFIYVIEKRSFSIKSKLYLLKKDYFLFVF